MMPHTVIPLREMSIIRQRIGIAFPQVAAFCTRLEPVPNRPSAIASAKGRKPSPDDRRRPPPPKTPPPKRGFGSPMNDLSFPEAESVVRQFEEEGTDEEEGAGQEEDAYESRPQYQIYSDSEYLPKRFIGKVDIGAIHGGECLEHTHGFVGTHLLVMGTWAHSSMPYVVITSGVP